jgi:hypothetical protein
MATSLLKAPIDRFDANNKTYTTSAGKVLKFRPIGPGAIDLKREQFSKLEKEPKPPLIEVNHGKGRTSEMPNLKDELYIALKNEHDSKVGRLLIEWIISTGLEYDIPTTPEPGSVFEAALEGMGDLNKITYRYLYFNSIMDSNDYAFLMEAIVGQQGVTQLGLSQAAEDFQNNS